MFAYLTSAMTHDDDGTGNNDLGEFQRKFPTAAAWLLSRNVERELLHLRTIPVQQMNQFLTSRLQELEILFAEIRECGVETIVPKLV